VSQKINSVALAVSNIFILPTSTRAVSFPIAIAVRTLSIAALLLMMAGNITAQDSTYGKGITIKPISILIPATLSSYGFIALKNPSLQRINQQIQESVTPNDKSRKCQLDDFLQYGPAGMALAMNLSGIKGKSKPLDAAAVYGASQFILAATVLPLKKMTDQLRPDSSGMNSFPSGHTANAFASAEFLRMEYKEVSPWIGVAGYAMAFTTGYLRIYNNKHRFSEVLTGACIGFISTKLSYWGWGKIRKSVFRKSN
jgi:membrane-associated phospholipid phosphatase